jgi:RNA polymerase sigma-70 factor (ECF subfamily)
MSGQTTDETRFAAWLTDYPAIPHKLSRAYTFDSADCADLHQEMLVQLWRSLPNFGGQSKDLTWIYRVCLNTALTWQRDRRRRVGRTDIAPPAAIEAAADDFDPVARRERDERLEALWNAIRALSPADRSLIVLALDGVSHREIGEITGTIENHVGVALLRARRKLAATLEGISDEL